jgi:hypothetical protein
VLAYLARYTHRVAISNSRLISLTDGKVTFRWKDYRQAGKARVTTLAAGEFMRRFLMHTLPDGFHRIRYYGLFANGHRAAKLTQCRELLSAPPTPPIKDGGADEGGMTESTDKVRACPHCGGRMLLVETFEVAQASAVCSRYSIRIDSS